MDTLHDQYRTDLIKLEQKAQDDFDKTILTLSGGALGITMAFINDIVGGDIINNPKLIYFAWLSWGASISMILMSFYSSTLALRKAITQIDSEKIYDEQPGGIWDILTDKLNAIGGILFIVGVILAATFVSLNLGA